MLSTEGSKRWTCLLKARKKPTYSDLLTERDRVILQICASLLYLLNHRTVKIDSLEDFQQSIQRAISGLEDIKKIRNSSGAAGSSLRAIKEKRGPKMRVVTNKWYHLPAGSPVPNFKTGQEHLLAHKRDGYGKLRPYRGR